MNIFEYIPLMKEMNNIPAFIGVGLLALFLVVIFFKMLAGMRQGFWRQLIRTARFVAAAIISYIIASGISGFIIDLFNEDTFKDLLTTAENAGLPVIDVLHTIVDCFNPETFEYLLLLPAAVVIIPFVFTALFFVVNNILKIASFIIIKIFDISKAQSAPSRLGGAIISGIEAILLFIILLLPFTGILSIVDDSYAMVFENDENRENVQIVEQYNSIFRPLIDNPAIELFCSVGSNALSKSFATVDMNGDKVDVRGDVMEIIHIVLVDGPALKDVDFKDLSTENKAAIDSIVDSVSDSPFLSGILVGLVQGTGKALGSGIIPVDFGDFNDVMDGVVAYLQGFSTATFGDDLGTIKEVYFALSDSKILLEMQAGNNNIMEILNQKREEGDDVLAKIIDALQGNSRTSTLLTALTKSLITTLIPEDAKIEINGVEVEVSYDTVKDSVNDILSVKKDDFATEEQFKEELANTLDGALSDNGIELEEEILGTIVDGINDNYDEIYSVVEDVTGGEVELTDEQFNNILLEYYQAFMQQMGGQMP